MHAARPRPRLLVGDKETAQLGQDVVEAPRLAPAVAGEGVAVHGVTRPHHRMSGVAHGGQEWGQRVGHGTGTHPRDQRQPARDPLRVEPLAQRQHVIGAGRGTELAADRVPDTGQELEVGTVALPGALAHPHHVGRAVVELTGDGVLARERFLVAEDQSLMTGEEVDLVQ